MQMHVHLCVQHVLCAVQEILLSMQHTGKGQGYRKLEAYKSVHVINSASIRILQGGGKMSFKLLALIGLLALTNATRGGFNRCQCCEGDPPPQCNRS